MLAVVRFFYIISANHTILLLLTTDNKIKDKIIEIGKF